MTNQQAVYDDIVSSKILLWFRLCVRNSPGNALFATRSKLLLCPSGSGGVFVII
jgi:hypothetical protein